MCWFTMNIPKPQPQTFYINWFSIRTESQLLFGLTNTKINFHAGSIRISLGKTQIGQLHICKLGLKGQFSQLCHTLRFSYTYVGLFSFNHFIIYKGFKMHSPNSYQGNSVNRLEIVERYPKQHSLLIQKNTIVKKNNLLCGDNNHIQRFICKSYRPRITPSFSPLKLTKS